MKDILLIDMDDVIVDLHTGWTERYNLLYDDNMDPEEFRSDWDIHNHVKCGVEIYKILARENFARSLDPMDGAVEGMEFLYNKYNLYIVSSASRSGQFALEKHLWIEKHLPFFDLKRLILCYDKWLISGDYMIDDRYKNIEKWKKYNDGPGIIMSAPHNEDDKADYRVDTWKDIIKLLG